MADITPVEHALYDIADYITVTEAARMTEVSVVTIRTWCEKYDIGKKIGGRWKVDPQKLALLLQGSVGATKSGPI